MGNSASKQFNDQQKQICLPVETWTDILLFISRNELAQTVSLTNWLFNAISRPRIDEHNKRIVPSLRFSNNGNGMAKLRFSRSFVKIPIAQVPPPINILGFERLSFRFINHQTLEFLRLIKPILGTNVSLRMRNPNESANFIQQLFKIIQEIFFEKSPPMPIHQLCNIIQGNVSKLATTSNNFNLLNMEFLKTIQFVQLDEGKAINEHILGWIHSPLDGNKPRYIFMYTYDINEFVEICKKRFLESIVPVSFIFHFDEDEETLWIWGEPTEFSIENHQTGEQLTLGWFNDEGRSYFMLCRFKIGDDQGWREIMKKVNNPNEKRTRLRIKL